MFEKILIANRGEIACRVARAARRARRQDRRGVLGRGRGRAARPGVRRGGAARACAAARELPRRREGDRGGAADRRQAIHPGYGFLSEKAEFAQACAEAGLVFVGPPPEAMRAMRDKAQARAADARAAGVPVVPGSDGVASATRRRAKARRRDRLPGAGEGGGGRRRHRHGGGATTSRSWRRRCAQCADRAKAAFGEGRVPGAYFGAAPHRGADPRRRPRHARPLGERECSIQRRHQKVVEEAPPPAFARRRAPALLQQLFDAAAARGARRSATRTRARWSSSRGRRRSTSSR